MDTRSPQHSALVVGGTKGIGRATAISLGSLGAVVGVVGRDHGAGAQVAETITAHGGTGMFFAADLSSMTQVARLAAQVRTRLGPLSVLIHTADALRRERRDSVDGIELSFATNYVSRFLLNRFLMGDLTAGAPARIVHVAAAGFPGALDIAHVPPPAELSGFAGHNIGQRANDVYTLEFARRTRGTGVTITTINPGAVDTDIRRNAPDGGRAIALIELLSKPWMTTPEGFSRQVVRLAISAELDGVTGALFNRKGKLLKARRATQDPERGRELWLRSEALVRPFLPPEDNR